MGRIENGKRKCDAWDQRRHARHVNAHGQLLALAEGLVAREQRRGVPVRPQAQQQQVQLGLAVAEHLAQLGLVGRGGLVLAQLTADPVHRRLRALDAVQQALLGHPVVGVLVVGRYGALVAEPQLGVRPVQAHGRHLLVRGLGRGAARQGDVATGPHARGDPLRGRARNVVDDHQLAVSHPWGFGSSDHHPLASRPAPARRCGRAAAPGGCPRRGCPTRPARPR